MSLPFPITARFSTAGDTLLYAANFLQNRIDVYNQIFTKVTTLAGNFQDTNNPRPKKPIFYMDFFHKSATSAVTSGYSVELPN